MALEVTISYPQATLGGRISALTTGAMWPTVGRVMEREGMTAAIRSSYHTHNHYCDGECEIAEMIEAAIAAGLSEIGISSHAPLPFETGWNMPPARLASYVDEVRELRERYRDQITVLLSAEIDFIPNDAVERYQEEALFSKGFDYFVGSVHFLGKRSSPRSFDDDEEGFAAILHEEYAGDMAAMTADYYRRLQGVLTMPGVRIVGHMDRIKRWNAGHTYFSGDEPWYHEAVEEFLTAVAASGHIVELNTAGWRRPIGEPYPSRSILRRIGELGIPVTVNSDAHSPDEVVRDFDRAEALLSELGIRPVGLGEVTLRDD